MVKVSSTARSDEATAIDFIGWTAFKIAQPKDFALAKAAVRSRRTELA